MSPARVTWLVSARAAARRDSRAHRSTRVSESGRLSRPPFSAAVTVSQCGIVGRDLDGGLHRRRRAAGSSWSAAGAVTVSPSWTSGSGCSPPPATTQMASSTSSCQTAWPPSGVDPDESGLLGQVGDEVEVAHRLAARTRGRATASCLAPRGRCRRWSRRRATARTARSRRSPHGPRAPRRRPPGRRAPGSPRPAGRTGRRQRRGGWPSARRRA